MINKLLKIKHMPQIIIVVFIILTFIIINIIYRNILKNNYTNEMVNIATQNENAIFKVEKILLYSSAGISNNQDNNLQDLDICQYTDIAIYIDNKNYIKETNEKNTVSELYIDNINIEVNSNRGEKIVNYKSVMDFGKFKMLENTDNIKYNIIRTNNENELNDYSNPSFYTDCSNPITLGYVNKDLKRYSATQNNSVVSYDGRILKKANIDLEDIKYNISFKIHIKNNINEEFIYNAVIGDALDSKDQSIYNGFTAKMKTEFNGEDKFFKLVLK